MATIMNAFLSGLLVFLWPTRCVSSSIVRDCSSASSRARDHCCQKLLYPIDVIWFRDSEQPCHQSAVNGRNPLVGSMCMCGPAFGDSFGLLSLALQTV